MSDLLLYFFMGLLFYQLIKSYRHKWKDAFLIIIIFLMIIVSVSPFRLVVKTTPCRRISFQTGRSRFSPEGT